MKKLVLVVLLMAVTVFVGCGGGGSNSGGGGGGTTVTLVSISVSPSAPSISKGASQQFKATGSYSDGTSKDLTATANWLSSNGAVATINTTGLATAVAPGTTTITASSAGVSGSTTLTVANPLVSIAVTPASLSIAPNTTQQFTATGTFQDGTTQDLTATATWQSSGSLIASISSGGLASAIGPGTVSISATSGSITGSATLTVTNPLVSIAVTPANSTVHSNTKPQFDAIGTYFDKTSNDITTTVTWTSSNPAVATISNALGLQGVATAVGAGQTTITATLGSISGSTSLNVSAATIQSIVVTPANAPMSLGLQQQYDALATFSDGTQQDVTNIVTWTSSDTTKVTLTTSGLATAVGITSSPVTITAKAANGVTGTTTVTVNAGNLVSIAIKLGSTAVTSDKIAQGTSRQYTAIGTFNNGSTLDITNQVNWTSGDTTIATVSLHSGLVKAASSVPLTDNPVTITATLQSISGTVSLDVTNATPTTLTVTPITATIQVGATQLFHATASFSDGSSQDVTISSTWTSANPAQVTVQVPGRVLGVAQTGTAGVTITAAFLTVSGTANVVVSNATLTGITLSPNSANLAPGSTITFQANGTYSDGSTSNLTGLATWATTNSSVATVTNGVTLGQSAGTATISAAYQGQTGTANVLVTSTPLTAISITPANPTTYVGVAISLVATGTTTQGPVILTPSATWASSAPSVATVSNAATRQGLTTGVGQGTATITAVFAGITGSTTLTVSSATLVSIAITPATPTIAPGSNQQFKATGTFSDGKSLDLTAQATWTSSNSAVAPINNAGLASGATAGTTQIGASFTQPGQPTVVAPPVTLTVN